MSRSWRDPAHTLAAAFGRDPLFEWVVPDGARRPAALSRLFRATLRRCAALGGVATVAGGAGVAGWIPSRRVRIQPADVVRFGMVGVPVWLRPSGALRLSRHDAVADRLVLDHASPDAAYLWVLGVEPDSVGSGLGRAAVEACVDQVRRACLGRLLLKTENPANVTLYRHLGFTIVAEEMVPASGLNVSVLAMEL